ncbi:MAG: 16S rRNA (cytosine(1402)-N(4))-methyltransferase RsmH [Rhodospirillales bacterium]
MVAGGHRPVLLQEVLRAVAPRAGGIYVDATFGGGGYAEAMLVAAPCRVVGVDRDPAALIRAEALIARHPETLTVLHGRFGDLGAILPAHGTAAGAATVDGIVFDLGVSSWQLDEADRGFSFRFEGPLDMRMDPTAGATAAEAVNLLPEAELADIIFAYGEERAARRIAAAIVRARKAEPIRSTGALAALIRRIVPAADDGIDPATRTFQALRIHVNDELGELDRGLIAAERLLHEGGRLCVVAFHSLEDRRVKAFLRARSGRAGRPSRHRPETSPPPAPSFRLITTRAVRPTEAEIAANPRARSARLRAAERTGAPAWPSAGRSVGSSRPARRAA